MEFLVAGASAVQIGTANYYDPTLTMSLIDELPAAFTSAGVERIDQLVATLKLPDSAATCGPDKMDQQDNSTATSS